MLRSDDRILTTHVGSLPRNAVLTDLLIRDEDGEAIDRAELRQQSERAVRYVVDKQVASGVDIVNDGEQPRVGFQTYVAQRMQGFGGESKRPRPRDYTDFPTLLAQLPHRYPRRAKVSNAPQAIAEVRYEDLGAGRGRVSHVPRGARQAAVAAARDVHDGGVSRHHRHDAAERPLRQLRSLCLRAGARRCAKEYELIARDFILQIDAPDLALERTTLFQDKSVAEFIKIAEMHVAALNEALANIPRERVRLHCCWGNYDGPHIHDVPLADILPGADPGQSRRALDRVRQSAPSARICRRSSRPSCRPEFLLLPGRHRYQDEFRGASRGRGQPHLRGRRRGGRPQPRHRLLRLRLRHLRRLRAGRRRGRLGQAQDLPRRRRARDEAAVGEA